jgi:mRNA interferase RelE/StbE
VAYRITISRDAQHALSRIHPRDQERLARAIDGLADDPHPPQTRPLQGMEGLLRLRVGDYRILYEIVEAEAEPTSPARAPSQPEEPAAKVPTPSPDEAETEPGQEEERSEPEVRIIRIGHRRDVYRHPLE